jgi:hypothetical protein
MASYQRTSLGYLSLIGLAACQRTLPLGERGHLLAAPVLYMSDSGGRDTAFDASGAIPPGLITTRSSRGQSIGQQPPPGEHGEILNSRCGWKCSRPGFEPSFAPSSDLAAVRLPLNSHGSAGYATIRKFCRLSVRRT